MHKANLYRIALTVSLGGFLFGFDASVISGVITFITPEFSLNAWEIGLVVGAPTLGGIIAALTVSPLSDVFGRKPILICIAALYSLSAVASALAPNYEALVIARFIGGLGFGSLGLAPIYISEISPATERGRFVSFNQLNIVIGFSAAYFMNYLFVNFSESALMTGLGINQHLWRWMLGVEIVPALLYVLLLLTVPESPRWLLLKGNNALASKIFRQLNISDFQCSQIHKIAPLRVRLATLFSNKLRLVLFLGCLLATAQQITGINAIYFYAPTIFELSGAGTNAAFTQATWIGVTNLVFTLIAMGFIDKIGRKPLLVAGLTGVVISMAVCSYEFNQATYQLTRDNIQHMDNKALLEPIIDKVYESDIEFKKDLKRYLGSEASIYEAGLIQASIQMNSKRFLAGILLFVASFALSLGPVMWVLLPEIFPNALRGVSMAVTGLVNSLVSFMVQFIFPWEIANLGASLTFLIYAIFGIISLVLIILLLPETRGKSLEAISKSISS